MTSLSELNDNHFGIDVDDTLIGVNPRSHILQKFIMDNYKTKQFTIVTFRYGKDFDDVWEDISKETYGNITKDMFVGAYHCSQELHDSNALYHKWKTYLNNPRKLKRVEDNIGMTFAEVEEKQKALLHWKGHICKNIGATVLIDDFIKMVEQGCKKYGIKLIDSFTITY